MPSVNEFLLLSSVSTLVLDKAACTSTLFEEFDFDIVISSHELLGSFNFFGAMETPVVDDCFVLSVNEHSASIIWFCAELVVSTLIDCKFTGPYGSKVLILEFSAVLSNKFSFVWEVDMLVNSGEVRSTLHWATFGGAWRFWEIVFCLKTFSPS